MYNKTQSTPLKQSNRQMNTETTLSDSKPGYVSAAAYGSPVSKKQTENFLTDGLSPAP